MLTADKLRENKRAAEKVVSLYDDSYKIRTLEKIRRILIDEEFVNYLEKVSKLGYDKALEKECSNVQYVVTADGYDIEDCSGTHIDYSVLVSW